MRRENHRLRREQECVSQDGAGGGGPFGFPGLVEATVAVNQGSPATECEVVKEVSGFLKGLGFRLIFVSDRLAIANRDGHDMAGIGVVDAAGGEVALGVQLPQHLRPRDTSTRALPTLMDDSFVWRGTHDRNNYPPAFRAIALVH